MAFDQGSVKGLSQAKRAFREVEPTMKAAISEATRETAQIIAADAARRLQRGRGVRTGLLKGQIGFSHSATSGFARVGIKKGTFWLHLPNGKRVQHRPTRIGHLVEFGHGGQRGPAQASPYMIPAADAQRSAYVQRIRAKSRDAEKALANRGGGLL